MADNDDLFGGHTSSGEHHGSGKGGGIAKAKVFGIPAIALGLLAALVVVGIVYFRNRRTASAAQAPIDTTSATSGLSYDDPNQVDPNSATGETYAAEGYTTQAAVDSYLAGDTSGTSSPVGLTPNGLPPPTTNNQWASLAADYLIGKGDDPTLVSDALNAYTRGQKLTTAEQAIVNVALQTFGEPPEGILAVNTTTGGGSDNDTGGGGGTDKDTGGKDKDTGGGGSKRQTGGGGGTKHTRTTEKTYTVRPGDTLWKIAEREYGNGGLFPRIEDANHLHNTIIFPGERLLIPAA